MIRVNGFQAMQIYNNNDRLHVTQTSETGLLRDSFTDCTQIINKVNIAYTCHEQNTEQNIKSSKRVEQGHGMYTKISTTNSKPETFNN